MIPENLPECLASISWHLEEHDPERDSCIYFLLRGEEVVYVGRSAAVAQRLRKHRKVKAFDRCMILRCSAANADRLERHWISRLSPEYNFSGTGNVPEHGGQAEFDLRNNPDSILPIGLGVNVSIHLHRAGLGTLSALREASEADILTVNGVGEKSLWLIQKYFAEPGNGREGQAAALVAS